MIRWHCESREFEGGTMPEFETVSLEEARVNTTSGRRRQFITEYTRYIRLITRGQAGRLSHLENENPATIRRRLDSAAKTTGMRLIIKRSGQDVYFWREDGVEEEPRTRRGRPRRRQDEPVAEETTALDQSFIEIE
jgi:hypothetical protein